MRNIMKTPSEPVFGECKLCLEQKQLFESHLMPRALYAPGKKGIQYATRSQSGQNPEHIKAHLLCFDCEQRFDHLGESEVLRWLAPKARKTFPLHDRLRVALPCGEIQGLSIVKITDTSAKVGARQSHSFGYEVQCMSDKPCLIAFLPRMVTGLHTTEGIQIGLVIPSVVYLCPDKGKGCRQRVRLAAGIPAGR
jgi:hypothetical protein